MGITLF